MVRVEYKREADASAGRIPKEVLQAFFDILEEWRAKPKLTLPGHYDTHQLRNAPHLWTLKLPRESIPPGWRDYRCVYEWTGSEVNVLRFGTWRNVYQHLPR